MTFDVVVVGSLNLDLVATASRIPWPGETVAGTAYREFAGGKGLNQAVAAARAGAHVALVGAVGDDDAGRRLRSAVVADGIDDKWLTTSEDLPTGRALITVDGSGENSIVVVAGANAAVTLDREKFPEARVVLAQLEIPSDDVAEAFDLARQRDALVVLNPSPAESVPADLLASCDLVIPNEHEIELIGGINALIDSGVGQVVVTRGANGADLISASGVHHQQPFQVTATDTTGAGDAFCGALCARLAARACILDALTFAAAAGALATTRSGAVPSLPLRADIDRLLGNPRGS